MFRGLPLQEALSSSWEVPVRWIDSRHHTLSTTKDDCSDDVAGRLQAKQRAVPRGFAAGILLKVHLYRQPSVPDDIAAAESRRSGVG